MQKRYLIIPLITITVAVLGSLLTSAGMPWYNAELIKPALTPPSWVFPLAWNTIFVLATASALITYDKANDEINFFFFKFHKEPKPVHIIALTFFAANAVLNVFWSFLFFYLQDPQAAFIEMLVLELTLIALHFFTWKISRIASLLLLPYTIWVAFASYLTYLILQLN
ncbi:TspO protein [Candidatus Peregrinibacteria bacterium CG10_big_fil_rev_8_21_14_0_10_36_19]|nr:MAG: TspO protein [Candidatus Peregrinibacteria bacterium CG10_big_fil_rev_8_21_14_0_10_36_19]